MPLTCVKCLVEVPDRKYGNGVYDDGFMLNDRRQDVLPDVNRALGSMRMDGYRFIHHECFDLSCIACDRALELDAEGYKAFKCVFNMDTNEWIAACRRHQRVFSCLKCGGLPSSEAVRDGVKGKAYFCHDHAQNLGKQRQRR